MPQNNTDHDWFEFYKKFINQAVYDADPDHQAVDLEITKKLVKGSPKEAQMTIQFLCGEYGKLKEKGDEMYLSFRLYSCSLALAHLLVYGYEDTALLMKFCKGLDKELIKFAKEMNPTEE